MKKYRKKPIVIEAIQWDGKYETIKIIQKNSKSQNIFMPAGTFYLIIKTLEGDMRADLNDWVVKGVKGEFYPCKPDIFDILYEKA